MQLKVVYKCNFFDVNCEWDKYWLVEDRFFWGGLFKY